MALSTWEPEVKLGHRVRSFSATFLCSYDLICALKKIVHNSVVPTDIDGAHTKVEFLTLA